MSSEQSKYYRLYLKSGKLALAVMYLRRVRVAGRHFAATLTHVLIAVTPPAFAVQNLGVGLQRPCRGQALGGVLEAITSISPTSTRTASLKSKFRPNKFFF
jgi:hypothetical protein